MTFCGLPIPYLFFAGHSNVFHVAAWSFQVSYIIANGWHFAASAPYALCSLYVLLHIMHMYSPSLETAWPDRYCLSLEGESRTEWLHFR